MRRLSIREVRNGLARLDEVLEREKEIIVTRRGKAIAKIVPLTKSEVPSHADLRAATGPLPRPSAELIREERDRS